MTQRTNPKPVPIPSCGIQRIGFRKYEINAWSGDYEITEIRRCSKYDATHRAMELCWYVGTTLTPPPFKRTVWPNQW